MRCFKFVTLGLFVLFESVLAFPLDSGLSRISRGVSISAENATTLSSKAIGLPSPANPETRVFTYDVFETDVSIDFILFLRHPLERQALGAAIYSGRRWLYNRIDEEGDDWVQDEDDPFVSTVPGRCYIRVDSLKTNTVRRRLTYRTLLTVFDGLWQALYLGRQEQELSMRIKVAGLIAGHGAIRKNAVPDLAAA
ncbi:MAG: hypothetical protein Q9222_000984 [Ikaeria aurantiellina]